MFAQFYFLYFYCVFFFILSTVPPQRPKIYNERGEPIQSRVGPFEEGSDLVLVCVVEGGSPMPQVIWKASGKLLTGTMVDFPYMSAINNKLVIKNLSRNHQHAIYTCHASNYPRIDVVTNVTIEMYRKFLSPLCFLFYDYIFSYYICSY